MTLLQAEDLELSAGGRVLFTDGAFRLDAGSRVALVGKNGAGKSTLMRLIEGYVYGDAQPEAGALNGRKGLTVALLTQDVTLPLELTPQAHLMSSVPERQTLEAELDARTEEITALSSEPQSAERDETMMRVSEMLAELGEKLGDMEERFGAGRASALLAGLGLTEAMQDQPLGELSGGWRIRVALAAALFREPDVLMLDEPTNHLDLPTLLWLLPMLRRYPGAMVVTSHDASFLEEVTGEVWQIEDGRLDTFQGTLPGFREHNAVVALERERTRVKDALRRAEMERFIDRFRAKASKAAQVQSRVKQLEKMGPKPQEERQAAKLKLRLPPPASSGRRMLTAKQLGIAYGEHRVFSGVELHVAKGDKLAFVGPNGAGKTSLLRILAGQLSPTEGDVEYGHDVKVAHFAQHQLESLPMDKTVYEAAYEVAENTSETAIRTRLGALLFPFADQSKQVSVLSGGERARLALARAMLRPCNMLLLDEPTNHLDLDSCDALIEALSDYAGTVLMVSHHQGLLRRVPTQLWRVEDGNIAHFPGHYDAFVASIQAGPATKTGPQPSGQSNGQSNGQSSGHSTGQADRRGKSSSGAPSTDLGALETQIEALDAKRAELQRALAAGSADPATKSALQQADAAYEAAMAQWEQMVEATERG